MKTLPIIRSLLSQVWRLAYVTNDVRMGKRKVPPPAVGACGRGWSTLEELEASRPHDGLFCTLIKLADNSTYNCAANRSRQRYSKLSLAHHL